MTRPACGPTAGGKTVWLGITDSHCRLCFAVALWNERRHPILKERLFGLDWAAKATTARMSRRLLLLPRQHPDACSLHEGALGKYPHRAFPYDDLVEENRRRGKDQPEYELVDTGVFADNRYFDVQIEYAKSRL